MIFNRALLLMIGSALGLAAQDAFDVASIKPNAGNDDRVMIQIKPGGWYVATGVTLRQLIGQAYDVRDFQISGGPGWAGSNRFDISAKAEGLPDRVPPDRLRPLLRALIESRFQLKVRKETREMPVYALVVGKAGSKLSQSTETSGPGPMIRRGRGQIVGQQMPMAILAQQLSQQLGRTVIDRTELNGTYDVTLNWSPEPGGGGGVLGGPPPPDAIAAADSNGPTIFTALQEQLGLRLESQKGPVPVLVIESVEKPSEN